METLNAMTTLVDEGVDAPAVVMIARQLAVMAGVRRPYFQALAIQAWMKRVWRYVDDPNDRDLLIAPDVLLQQFDAVGFIAGDCDEAAIVGAALGRAIGLSAQFVVLGFASDDPTQPDRFAHVFAVLLTDDGQHISLDVTRPAGPVPPPTRILTVDV